MSTAKKVTCTKCNHYSFTLRRCKIGKVNPRSKRDTISAAEMMGGDYICGYNQFKADVQNIQGYI